MADSVAGSASRDAFFELDRFESSKTMWLDRGNTCGLGVASRGRGRVRSGHFSRTWAVSMDLELLREVSVTA